MKILNVMLVAVLIFGGTALSAVQKKKLDIDPTPIGFWKTIDDKTHKPKSIVKIWKEQDGTLKGKILKLFREPNEEQNPLCDKCKGERKDKPILGMEFLWGFKGFGSEWEDGKILDPKNGKIYHCQMKVIEEGKKLKVFGYIRVIIKIGRSQVWLKPTPEDLEGITEAK